MNFALFQPQKTGSVKRTRFLSLGGKTRVRVDEDLHDRFVEFCDAFKYTRHLDALLFLLDFALMVLHVFGPVAFLLVRNRADK